MNNSNEELESLLNKWVPEHKPLKDMTNQEVLDAIKLGKQKAQWHVLFFAAPYELNSRMFTLNEYLNV